jgi:hypothetical protein
VKPYELENKDAIDYTSGICCNGISSSIMPKKVYLVTTEHKSQERRYYLNLVIINNNEVK